MMETSTKPLPEILEHISMLSRLNKEQTFNRLFRYLLRPEIYFLAYAKLYSNNGALTRGSNNDTADGFGFDYVEKIISDLRQNGYKASPVRRIYIKKKNGKLRPLGIPSFRDKLLQEAVRRILESIYEPVFDDCSHGFRPKRSCHTALLQIKHNFKGVPWIIEGDIHGCFDNIRHNTLLSILGKKIKDQRFLHIIREFLAAGYLEDWTYHNTYSGTPQGGICSPILANIYLNELDVFLNDTHSKLEDQRERDSNGKLKRPKTTKEYNKLHHECYNLRKKISSTEKGELRNQLIRNYKSLHKQLRCTRYYYNMSKRIFYVRYADDWLVGVMGSKSDCVRIKEEIREFLWNVLGLELSEEKTLITHSSNKIRFLGYDITIRRNNDRIATFVDKNGIEIAKRSLNGSVNLTIPLKDKVEQYILNKGSVIRRVDGTLHPIRRNKLMGKPDHEIVKYFNTEVLGIFNYYGMADNVDKLRYFSYLMERSCLLTLAAKHKTSCRKIINKYRHGSHWSVPYRTKKESKRAECIRFVKTTYPCYFTPTVDTVKEHQWFGYKSNITNRLRRGICECCGVKMERKGVVHVIKRLKELGHQPWEILMKKMRRKTLVICPECHLMIHSTS